MADQGAIVNPESIKNLPKQVSFFFSTENLSFSFKILFYQRLNKRQLKRSRSLVSLLLGTGNEEEIQKAKNIYQTELMVDLRDAILQVGRHFQSLDPKNVKLVRLFPKNF